MTARTNLVRQASDEILRNQEKQRMMYAMNSQQAQRGTCTYFRLLIVYQGEMNGGAEEPRGKPRAALVICHIQTDTTTLNQAFFLLMM